MGGKDMQENKTPVLNPVTGKPMQRAAGIHRVDNIECPRCHMTARYVGYSNAGPEFVCDNMHLVGLPGGEAETL